MPAGSLIDEYMERLLRGDRVACRRFVQDLVAQSQDVTRLYHDLLWPAMERLEKLYRGDRINHATESMATRIHRAIADQLQLSLPRREPTNRRMVIICAPGEPEELGAQMCADLFEANGWTVYFLGGGVPSDEVLTLLGQSRPDILMIYGTQPSGVPAVRQLVDQIREIGINPTMNILVSGGVFNRADSLWREVNADLFARNAKQAMVLAEEAQPRIPDPPRTGLPKKRRRRRKAAALAVDD
jgi:methanogenic corrinoid protein MtbC1